MFYVCISGLQSYYLVSPSGIRRSFPNSEPTFNYFVLSFRLRPSNNLFWVPISGLQMFCSLPVLEQWRPFCLGHFHIMSSFIQFKTFLTHFGGHSLAAWLTIATPPPRGHLITIITIINVSVQRIKEILFFAKAWRIYYCTKLMFFLSK